MATSQLPASTVRCPILQSVDGEVESRPMDVSPENPRIRILVVDDHTVVRGVFHRLIAAEPDFTVIGEAVNGAEALLKAQELQPDVILLDISLPDINGLELAARIRTITTSTEILIVSDYCEGGSDRAFSVGARGYLLKSDAGRELATAVRTVNKKEISQHEDSPPMNI
jgi:two-component system, NarL family, response regulator DesR